VQEVCRALSTVWAAVLGAALDKVIASSLSAGTEAPARIAVIGMGRLGGGELGYGSDADVLFVCDPNDGEDESEALKWSQTVADRVRKMPGTPSAAPPLEVDVGLRPEGKNGPIVRTLASYEAYYRQWAQAWEVQALLRAHAVAGDADLGLEFLHMIDVTRYPEGGVSSEAVREIRRIKARIDAERLPRGADPATHTKLGRGGLADVEWTVQLLQLKYADSVAALRTTTTLDALVAAEDAGLVAPHDARILAHAWELASSLRDAVVMYTGRRGGSGSDLLPHDLRDLAGVARILGYPAGAAADLEEDYLRASRRCRQVMERLFYGAS